MALYVGVFLCVLYRMGRYTFRTLRRAYKSGPVALCNTLFLYGVILTFAGVMEKMTARESSGSMPWVIIAGLMLGGCSFLYGKVKASERGERFPDVQAARQFL
jgi:hypothetical protein